MLNFFMYKKPEPIDGFYAAPINTRMMAWALDLMVLIYFVMEISSFIFSIYFPDGYVYSKVMKQALGEHPELAKGGNMAIMQYIYHKYPAEFRASIEQIVFSYMTQMSLIGLYVIIMHKRFGKTVGKFLVGIKVVDKTTKDTITYGQAIIRYLGLIIAALPLGLGVFWGAFNQKKRCWHDYFSDTIVVVDPNSWYSKFIAKLKAYFNIK